MVAEVAKPSRPLGKDGQAFWYECQTGYEINNCGGRQILQLACETIDNYVAISAEISAVGLSNAGKLVKDRQQLASLLKSCLKDLSPYIRQRDQRPRAPGRPPRNIHWDGSHAVD
jgi:hypothetical protein